MNKRFFKIDFNRENFIFKKCKIEEQYLSHSKQLILRTFEKEFKTEKEARIYLEDFLYKVGTSQRMFFKIMKGGLKE